QERPRAAARVAVAELAVRVVERDLEQALLDAMVEPGAAEDEAAQPVHQRLAFDERDALPVPDDVAPEPAARLAHDAVRDELDEVGRLVLVQLVPLEQAEPHGRRSDALFEVLGVEAEPVADVLDHVAVPGPVVVLRHEERVPPCPSAETALRSRRAPTEPLAGRSALRLRRARGRVALRAVDDARAA